MSDIKNKIQKGVSDDSNEPGLQDRNSEKNEEEKKKLDLEKEVQLNSEIENDKECDNKEENSGEGGRASCGRRVVKKKKKRSKTQRKKKKKPIVENEKDKHVEVSDEKIDKNETKEETQAEPTFEEEKELAKKNCEEEEGSELLGTSNNMENLMSSSLMLDKNDGLKKPDSRPMLSSKTGNKAFNKKGVPKQAQTENESKNGEEEDEKMIEAEKTMIILPDDKKIILEEIVGVDLENGQNKKQIEKVEKKSQEAIKGFATSYEFEKQRKSPKHNQETTSQKGSPKATNPKDEDQFEIQEIDHEKIKRNINKRKLLEKSQKRKMQLSSQQKPIEGSKSSRFKVQKRRRNKGKMIKATLKFSDVSSNQNIPQPQQVVQDEEVVKASDDLGLATKIEKSLSLAGNLLGSKIAKSTVAQKKNDQRNSIAVENNKKVRMKKAQSTMRFQEAQKKDSGAMESAWDFGEINHAPKVATTTWGLNGPTKKVKASPMVIKQNRGGYGAQAWGGDDQATGIDSQLESGLSTGLKATKTSFGHDWGIGNQPNGSEEKKGQPNKNNSFGRFKPVGVKRKKESGWGDSHDFENDNFKIQAKDVVSSRPAQNDGGAADDESDNSWDD